jgi:hypothetical protein
MCLVSFEVANRFRVGFPHLHHTKKDNTIWAVSNFKEISKWIVRKPFWIPEISTVLQELEGFTYATACNLNMSYYTIRLDPDASKRVPLSYHGVNTLTSGYQWALHVLMTSPG